MNAIVESFYPSSADDYAVFLEDDIELSPLFYLWTKWTLLHYRYGKAINRNPSMFGISLYTPRIQEMTFPRRPIDTEAMFEPRNTPFLFQLPCSWGAVYFPEHWKEFYHYLSGRLRYMLDVAENRTFFSPEARKNLIVPNSRSNVWQSSWKKYFIELSMLRGYVMLYPNFQNQTSFSTNHLEPGEHISIRSRVRTNMLADFEIPLMNEEEHSTYLPTLPRERLPDWPQLPIIDLFNQEKTLDELTEYGAYLASTQS